MRARPAAATLVVVATVVVALSGLVTSATPLALADEAVDSEDWYALYVGETKSGHAHTVVAQRSDPDAAGGVVWVTETTTDFRLARLGNEIQLTIVSRIEEDGDGRVLGFRHAQRMSNDEVVTEGVVRGDRIVLASGGLESTVDYPAGALGPHAVDARVRAAGFAAGSATDVAAFSTDSPARAARMAFRIGEREPRSVLGLRRVLYRCDVTNSASSARGSVMWVDGAGRMFESVSEIPGIGSLRMVRTEEGLARSQSTAAEIFDGSLVTPDRAIPEPRAARHAVLRLSRRAGAGAFGDSVPAGGGQTVRADETGAAVVVEVDAAPAAPKTTFALPVTDASLARYLDAAPYLETQDEEVRRHATAAVGDARDALVCARRIERYVREHVTDKGYDVGFASAAEVVRRREGDCTEHAVLSAAMARVVGLPSRVVAGLVYLPGKSAEGVGPRGAFGYHMWTEVLVADGVWRPLDAALGGFDATHVALGRSDLALESPIGDLVLPLLETIRDLAIEVVEVR